jgi:hypothetical protein
MKFSFMVKVTLNIYLSAFDVLVPMFRSLFSWWCSAFRKYGEFCMQLNCDANICVVWWSHLSGAASSWSASLNTRKEPTC